MKEVNCHFKRVFNCTHPNFVLWRTHDCVVKQIQSWVTNRKICGCYEWPFKKYFRKTVWKLNCPCISVRLRVDKKFRWQTNIILTSSVHYSTFMPYFLDTLYMTPTCILSTGSFAVKVRLFVHSTKYLTITQEFTSLKLKCKPLCYFIYWNYFNQNLKISRNPLILGIPTRYTFFGN